MGQSMGQWAELEARFWELYRVALSFRYSWEGDRNGSTGAGSCLYDHGLGQSGPRVLAVVELFHVRDRSHSTL
jgi:hypothetical protein